MASKPYWIQLLYLGASVLQKTRCSYSQHMEKVAKLMFLLLFSEHTHDVVLFWCPWMFQEIVASSPIRVCNVNAHLTFLFPSSFDITQAASGFYSLLYPCALAISWCVLTYDALCLLGLFHDPLLNHSFFFVSFTFRTKEISTTAWCFWIFEGKNTGCLSWLP